MEIEQALAIFKEGKILIWRTSEIGGLPFREVSPQTSAHEFKPQYDEDVVAEELG